MNKNRLYAVILAGGKGERFWPLSTERKPKQLLSLVGGEPLVSQAVRRLGTLIPPERVFIVTGADLAEAVRAALPGVPAGNVVGEPFGRDTAAAVALGAALVSAREPGAAFCVLTADHVIRDEARFRGAIEDAFRMAMSGDWLVTIGIPPAFPSTGFGYIECAGAIPFEGKTRFFRALRFVEKPDAETARHYVSSGRYSWNSGMFIWSLAALGRAFARHRPELAGLADRLRLAAGTPGFDAALRAEYDRLEKISIDYAVMEKADNIVMAQCDFDWDDIGSWAALEHHFPKDADNNVIVGCAEALDARGNIVVSSEGLTALLGVENLVVVRSGPVTLICRRDNVQDVRKMVEKLRGKGRYGEWL
ncbi:MAG: mannose-1-phosphate guanylyltransferase [Lentisphaerae bacterium]|nr:mannose-1-phosphate guanylyltransferase [Lentisphaerota bacterium]